MLLPLSTMPDDAMIRAFISSRKLTKKEETHLIQVHTNYLKEWSSTFLNCLASEVQILFNRWVVGWSIDDRPRRSPLEGVNPEADLIGTELDPLYRQIENFEIHASPAIKIRQGEALVVNGKFFQIDMWGKLLTEGMVTLETLILRPCSIIQWKTGQLILPIKEEPSWRSFFKDKI